MKLSIIIVNFNKKDLLNNLLNSIKVHCKNLDYEVIVVDNASTDESTKMVRSNFPEFKLITLDRNLGCCPAYNLGFKESKGEYICIMHEDAIIHENTMQNLVEFLDKNPKTGYVGPKNIDKGKNVLKSIERFHTPIYEIIFSYKVIFSKIFNRFNLGYLEKIPKKPVKVNWMRISCLVFRKKAIKDPHLFDGSLIEWWDDPYLQFKMHKDGWDGYYIPDAVITHFQGLTREIIHTSGDVAPMELLWIYSKYKYFKEFYGSSGLFIVKCNDLIVFTIYIFINLIKYYTISKNNNTKWEINRWLKYLVAIFDTNPNFQFNL